jgi:hypothetical protein
MKISARYAFLNAYLGFSHARKFLSEILQVDVGFRERERDASFPKLGRDKCK